jgi:hypothetical protein
MINLSKLSWDEIVAKFEVLPPKTREVFESPSTSATITSACKSQGVIGENDILIVEQMTGLVILGLVDPQMMSKEINEYLSLNDMMKADNITKEIQSKILSLMPPSSPVTPPLGSTPSPATPPKPMFIQRETSVVPIHTPTDGAKSSELERKISSFFSAPKPATPPSAPARLQIGKETVSTPATSGSVRTPLESPRVVHYGELKTVLTPPAPPKTAGANSPSRPAPMSLENIGEAKPAPAPRPATAPLPPVPPSSLPGVRGVPPPPPAVR